MNIGKAIRVVRAEQGISQAELVRRMGDKMHTHVSRLESGDVPNPRLDKVQEIASALGMTASELVHRAEELS